MTINAQGNLAAGVKNALHKLYGITAADISFQKTRKEFEGDFTLVTFPYIKQAKKTPEAVGQELGAALVASDPNVSGFNVVKGFLNIVLSDAFWLKYFETIKDEATPGHKKANSSGRTVMVEYSSPNTNKPLHLGH